MSREHYGADTKRRILEAACAAFTRSGYDGTSIRQIVAEAGTNIASVNYHFGGKDALYREVLQVTFSELEAELGFAVGDVDMGGDPSLHIHAFAKHRLMQGLGSSRQFPPRLLGWEIIAPRVGFKNLMAKRMAKIEEQLVVLLSPLFGPDLPQESKALAARWFFAVTIPPPPIALGVQELLGKEPRQADLERAACKLAGAAVAGLTSLISAAAAGGDSEPAAGDEPQIR